MKQYYCAALIALAGCTTPQRAGDPVTVMWHRVDDVQAVCQKIAGRKEVFAIRGCSKWTDGHRPGERVCNIYSPAPESETDTQNFTTLGHELLHCFDGNWHDRWGRMKPEEASSAAGGTRK